MIHVVSKRDSFPIALKKKERLFFFLKNILKL